jgi:hypothetical protein
MNLRDKISRMRCAVSGSLDPTVFLQGCGSGSGLDPDSETLWIRIRIGNPDPGARKLRNFSGKNAVFSYLKKNYH